MDDITMNDKRVILCYGDSLIRRSDLDTLAPSHWINDIIISFALEYMEKDLFSGQEDKISLISPQVTQCIKLMTDSEVEVILDPLDIRNKELVLFVVNNNNSPSTAGGSHWSLLSLLPHEKLCKHYDSSSPMNSDAAKSLFVTINNHLKGCLKFEEAETPQQNNANDCGMYCISIAERLCEMKLKNSTEISLHDLTPQVIKTKRLELLDRIKTLSNQN